MDQTPGAAAVSAMRTYRALCFEKVAVTTCDEPVPENT